MNDDNNLTDLGPVSGRDSRLGCAIVLVCTLAMLGACTWLWYVNQGEHADVGQGVAR